MEERFEYQIELINFIMEMVFLEHIGKIIKNIFIFSWMCNP